MDDSAHSVQVVETDKDLLGHAAHQWQRDSAVVVAFHDFEQIHAKNFEDHDEVLAVGSRVNERVQQLDSMTVFNRVPTLLLEGLVVLLVPVDTVDPVL